MRGLVATALATLLVLAFTVPVNGTPSAAYWATGRLLGTWTIDTTPNYKGHSPAGMHAVCVNTISAEVRLVPITPLQAYGDPGTGQGALLKGGDCPASP